MIQPGTVLPVKQLSPIELSQLQAYAQASGDPNRIHLDETVARAAGLPGIIAHGMLSMAFLGNQAAAFGREQGLQLVELQTRFKAMTFLGDILSIYATVKEASPGAVTLDLQIKNQKGELTTTGTAKFK